MPEEKLDDPQNGNPGQGDVPPGDPPNNDAPPQPGDEPKFNKTQLEQLNTVVGRILKKRIEEDVLPRFEREPSNHPYHAPANETNDGDVIKKFNESLQTKIFEGDVLGAIQMAVDVQNRAKENLSKGQLVEAERIITSYSEKPFYKDIHSSMDKMAKEAIAQGVPPKWAVEHAYHKALSVHLTNNGREHEDENLGMLDGGMRHHQQKPAKLPEQFRQAFERDKAKGLVKTEQEWIAALSPSIRKQHNI